MIIYRMNELRLVVLLSCILLFLCSHAFFSFPSRLVLTTPLHGIRFTPFFSLVLHNTLPIVSLYLRSERCIS